MKPKFSIIELAQACPGLTISLSASELSTFARQLISEVRREYERESATTNARSCEIFRSSEEVKANLGVSDSTVYRLTKAGILKPVWIGGQKRFKQSDIDKITSSNN